MKATYNSTEIINSEPQKTILVYAYGHWELVKNHSEEDRSLMSKKLALNSQCEYHFLITILKTVDGSKLLAQLVLKLSFFGIK